MKTADWILVVITALGMLIAAVIVAVRSKSPSEYFTGGRRAGRLLLVLFAFGSGTSTDSQASVMTATWRFGLSGLWWQFLWLPIAPFFWILAPLLRRLRAITTADFFAMRFGPATALLYAIYGSIICVVLMAGVLFSSARLLETLTDPFFGDLAARLNWSIPVVDVLAAIQPPGIDAPPAIIWKSIGGDELIACCLGLVLMVVSTIGGLGSLMLIDAAQGLIRIVLTILLLFLILPRIGGWGAMQAQEVLKPGMFDFVASSDAIVKAHQEPFTPFYLCALSAAALIGILVQPQIVTICGAGRTELDSRVGFTFGNLLKRCMAIVWSMIGLVCIAWYLGPNSPLSQLAEPQPELLDQLRVAASRDLADLPGKARAQIQQADLAFADRLFARVIRDTAGALGPGLVGIFAAMILAAAVSHCGTQAVIASGLFAEQVYRQHVSPGRNPAHYLLIARLCSPVLVGIALLLQTTFTDVTDALKLVIKTPAIIGISMWMGLFWIRWNSVAVWCTTIAGAGMAILVGYYPEEVLKSFPVISQPLFFNGPDGLTMIDAWKIVLIVGSATLTGVVAAFMTDPQSDDQLEHFYRVIRSPIRPEERGEAGRFEPPLGDDLVPAISFLGWQLPGPTRGGTIGFVAAWVVVIGLVLAAKWLSLQL